MGFQFVDQGEQFVHLGDDAALFSEGWECHFEPTQNIQMEMLNPKLAILDETDSGLDIDAVRTIAQSVDRFRSPKKSILIITHITRILQDLPVDHVHILSQGRIVRTEGADIIDEVARNGFASVLA